MRILLRLLGYENGFQMVSGYDPEDELMRTQRITFEMRVNGQRVRHTLSYSHQLLEESRNPERTLNKLGDQMRKAVAWKVLLADRAERDYIRFAMEIYQPDTPFWRAYLRWLIRSYVGI